MRFHRRTSFIVLSVLLLAAARRGAGQTALQESPFLPTGGTATPGPAPAETLQLSGISVIGNTKFVSLYDSQAKRSHWIAVGQSADGVQVVSCDDSAGQAVVRAQGELKLLVLPKSAVHAGQSAAAAAAPPPLAAPAVAFSTGPAGLPGSASSDPATPAAPAVPLTAQAEQEREARMLVSDLLEIGQQQRKAYEEAQRKAAETAGKKEDKS